MKIGLFFNMANNQYLITKALRSIGVDATLIINAKDFGMSFPHWEEAVVKGVDPYHADAMQLAAFHSLPRWIKTWYSPSQVDPIGISQLMRMARDYDLIQLAPPCVVYLQFVGKPFIVHESGWIRNFPYLDGLAEKLARRGYVYAQYVVMTNPDCYSILQKIRHRASIFIPFVVDSERYKPKGIRNTTGTLRFFNPSRQQWEVKGTDRLLRAFGSFIKKGYKAELTLVDWGTIEGVSASKTLISKLGITKQVKWIAPVSKPILIELYASSDAVFDQYLLGSYGTSAPEALACETPVVMYLDSYWNRECYGEVAPVLNARTDEEILEAMCALTDSTTRVDYGRKGREYVIRHHSPNIIAHQYLDLYRRILE